MMKSATAKSASAGRFQKPPKEEDDDDDAAFVGGGGSHRRPSPTEIVLSASFRDTPVEQELAASRAAFRFCPEMKLGFISLPGDVAVVFLRNAEVAALSLKPETEAFGLQGMQGPAAHRDDKQRSLRAWFGKKSKPSGQAKCVKEEAETGEEECGHDSWQDVLQKLDLLAGHREAILVVERGCAEESRRIALLQQFATLARGISVLPVLDAKGCAHFLQTMLRSISASAPGGGGATPPAGKWGRMDVEAAAFGRAFRFARAKSNRAAAEPSGARALATLPDVPPKAAEALLRRFKTVAAVLAASEEEMAQALGGKGEQGRRLSRLFRCRRGHHDYACKSAAKANAAASKCR